MAPYSFSYPGTHSPSLSESFTCANGRVTSSPQSPTIQTRVQDGIDPDYGMADNGMSARELKSLRDKFAAYDADSSDSISIHELESFLNDINFDLTTPNDLQRVFNVLDKDGSGTVSFEEFKAFWAAPSATNVANLETGACVRRKLTMIHPDIYCYVYQTSNPTTFAVTIECTQLMSFSVKFDYTDSANLDHLSSPSNVTLTPGVATLLNMAPFHRHDLVTLTVGNPLVEWKLRYETSVKIHPEMGEEPRLRSYLEKVQSADLSEITVNLASLSHFAAANPTVDFNTIPLEAFRTLLPPPLQYIDSTFPPTLLSIAPSSSSISSSGFAHAATSFTFRRPPSFLPTPPTTLFTIPPHPTDIQQGMLGNCWLMSSLAAITEHPPLLDALIPDSDPVLGLYRVRLHVNGIPKLVTIDDYFPCYPSAGPVFSRNTGGDVWVQVVEKAVAKWAGGYGNLRGGVAGEGLRDLTGFPTGVWLLGSERVRKDVKEGRFWPLLKDWLKRQCLVCASTPGEGDRPRNEYDATHARRETSADNHGLIPGHAYTILHCVEVGGNMLLNIRNPWGAFEWNGDWGDSSLLWSDRVKREISEQTGMSVDDVVRDDDGCFWMSYFDWIKFFASVSVCEIVSAEGIEWCAAREKICFRDFAEQSANKTATAAATTRQRRVSLNVTGVGRNAAAAPNPEPATLLSPLRTEVYKLFVAERTECVVGLHNRDVRPNAGNAFANGVADYPPIGVSVLKKARGGAGGGMSVKAGVGGYCLVASAGVRKERQVQTESVMLDEGEYVVVCYTVPSNEHENENEEHHEEYSKSSKVDSVLVAVGEIFDRYDSDCSGVLDLQDFTRLVDAAIGEENIGNTRLRSCARLILGWSQDYGGVSKKRLQEFCRKAFTSSGDEHKSTVSGLLQASGYVQNDDEEEQSYFVLREQIVGGLTVHTSKPVRLKAGGMNSAALGDAMSLPVRLFGEMQDADDYGFKCFVQSCGENGVAIGIMNVKRVAIYVKVDCSGSKGCCSHRGDLTYSAKLQPGEFAVMHYLYPEMVDSDWAWSYTCNVNPPPSPTWLSYYSASHQCCYYENVASGAVQWTPPPEGEGVEAGDEGEYEEEEEEEEYEEAQEEDQYEEQQYEEQQYEEQQYEEQQYEEQQYEQEYEQGQYEEEQEERSSSSPHEQYSPIQQPSSPAAAASSSPPLTISPRSHAPSDISSIPHSPPPRPSPTSNPSRAAAPHYQKQLSPALQPSDATVTPYNTHHTTDNPTSQYDKAMRTKQETERRRQLQRHQQQAAELSSMKQPKVNRNSAKMVAKATMPIGDRAKEQAERKQAKLDKLRREKDEVEMASLSTKPVIHTGKNTYHRSDSISSEASMQRAVSGNPNTQATGDFSSRMVADERKKLEKRHVMKEQSEIREIRDLTLQPSLMAPKSRQMVNKIRQRENANLIRKIQEEARENPSGVAQDADTVLAALNGDVGARQYLVAKQNRQTQRTKQEEYEKQIQRDARPTIDERSKLIKRPGDVATRLYTHNETQQRQMEKLVHQKEVESRYDNTTMQELYKPQINSKSANMAQQRRMNEAVKQTQHKINTNDPTVEYTADGQSVVLQYNVADSLINQGKLYQDKLVRKKATMERRTLEQASKPKISKQSAEIAARHTTHSLHRPINTVKKSTLKDIEDSKPTFKPKLETTASVDRHRGGYYDNDGSSTRGGGVAQRNQVWMAAKEERAEKAKEAQQALEDAELTFQPNVKSNMNSNKIGTREPLESRTRRWQEGKEKRLEQQRVVSREMGLDECTFQPNMDKSFGVRRSNSNVSYDEPPEGGGGELAEEREGAAGREYEQATRDISRRTSIFQNKAPDPRASRRKSVQEALGELDDFMALEQGVMQGGCVDTSDVYSEDSYEDEDGGDFEGGGGEGGELVADSDLPPGWLEFKTEEGKIYYHNALNGETTWTKPSGGMVAGMTPARKGRGARWDDNDEDVVSDEAWMSNKGGGKGDYRTPFKQY